MPGRLSTSKDHIDALKTEVQRLSQIIGRISDESETTEAPHYEIPSALGRRPITGTSDLKTAKWLLAEREARQSILDAVYIDDVPWTILLDLYVAGKDQRLVSVTSACVASGAAPTTALRAIKLMEQAGYIKRSPDQFDGRRVFLRLSAYFEVRIAAYLERLADSLKLLVTEASGSERF